MKSNKRPNAADSSGNNAGSADEQGQVRSYAEVTRSRDAVRSYSADGMYRPRRLVFAYKSMTIEEDLIETEAYRLLPSGGEV